MWHVALSCWCSCTFLDIDLDSDTVCVLVVLILACFLRSTLHSELSGRTLAGLRLSPCAVLPEKEVEMATLRTDTMMGRTGAAGPAQDLWHQPVYLIFFVNKSREGYTMYIFEEFGIFLRYLY